MAIRMPCNGKHCIGRKAGSAPLGERIATTPAGSRNDKAGGAVHLDEVRRFRRVSGRVMTLPYRTPPEVHP